VLESEAGHIDFAPATAVERQLADAMRNGDMAASWEQVLLLQPGDGTLAAATPGLTQAQRSALLAALTGRFTANMILTTCAWNGALLTGPGVARLIAADNAAAFDASFQNRRTFRRIFVTTPCWLVEQSDPVLTGLATLVAGRRLPA
jgi:glucokinase